MSIPKGWKHSEESKKKIGFAHRGIVTNLKGVGGFRKGNIPFSFGTKGILKPNSGTFKKIDIKKRFWDKVKKTNKCWNWLGCKTSTGYAQIIRNKRLVYVHRLSYEFNIGKIPTGLTIDHKCKNRICVNPKHLEAVTLRVNIQRSKEK